MSFLMESLSYKEQIKAILFLQKSFFNIFHDFWVFLNYFDTEPFYIALGCFAISFLGYRKGVKYLYFLCFSLFANHLAKVFCSMPRPFDFQEDLAFISMKPGLGFPSGGAMGALLIYFCFTHNIPKLKTYLFAGLYFLMISFSRVYLGVHFFTDLIGGWVLAFVLWKIFLACLSYIEVKSENQTFKISLFILTILLNTLCYLLAPFSVSNILFPIICALAFSHFFLSPMFLLNETLSLGSSLIRLFASIFGVVFIMYLASTFASSFGSKTIFYFLVGFWISFVAPFGLSFISPKVNCFLTKISNRFPL